MNELALRKQIVATALEMNARGLNRGKSGNVSARFDAGFLVTPTGMAYESTQPVDIVAMTQDGTALGPRLPSSEWRFHRDIYAARREVTFGTQQLSDHALCALEGRKACLLANHGMIAVGASLTAALALAVEVEALAEQYWRALQIGPPNLLSDVEMEIVLEKFCSYGQPDAER